MSRALVIVGAGPRTTGILLALAALPEVPATEIHVIDPYPAGPGRIWRAVQPTEVWMNNTSDEITVYADGDPAVPAAVPGPGLAEWAGERHFVPRRDAAAYLRDAFDRAVAVLTDPATHPGITVTEHRTRAEHVTPPDGGVRTARLADGTELRADAVLLAQGHLDVDPGDPGTVGEGHIPPGYTVDQDFSAIPAGEDVLVRGFGLAFIDLMEILTEGRGGRFERGAGDAVPTYVPSGREPVLWVGSRRGVPYRSKPVDGPPAVELHHLVPATLDGIPRTPDGHLEPGHLRRLLTAELHGQWSAVTDEPLDLRRIDRPLDGLAFPDRHAVGREVEAVVLTNLGRATDLRHPQDGLLYSTLVASYFVLHSLLAEGLLDDADRDLVAQVEGSFSYVCSGPPPERLGNLLALHRAGVVRCLGPDTRFRRNPGAGPRFLADSPVVVGDPVPPTTWWTPGWPRSRCRGSRIRCCVVCWRTGNSSPGPGRPVRRSRCSSSTATTGRSERTAWRGTGCSWWDRRPPTRCGRGSDAPDNGPGSSRRTGGSRRRWRTRWWGGRRNSALLRDDLQSGGDLPRSLAGPARVVVDRGEGGAVNEGVRQPDRGVAVGRAEFQPCSRSFRTAGGDDGAALPVRPMRPLNLWTTCRESEQSCPQKCRTSH